MGHICPEAQVLCCSTPNGYKINLYCVIFNFFSCGNSTSFSSVQARVIEKMTTENILRKLVIYDVR